MVTPAIRQQALDTIRKPTANLPDHIAVRRVAMLRGRGHSDPGFTLRLHSRPEFTHFAAEWSAYVEREGQ